MIHYNKLVRDKIPEIKAREKKKIEYHEARTDEEYWHKLKEKLQEEIDEFGKRGDIGSFGDVLEVLEAVRDFKKFDHEVLTALKKDKKKSQGGFEKRIVLQQSEDEIGERQEQTEI